MFKKLKEFIKKRYFELTKDEEKIPKMSEKQEIEVLQKGVDNN